ncbi:MAG: hypothetical protein C5B49_12160, partial [Bdellovibrio sp.]
MLLDAIPSLISYVGSDYRYRYCNKTYSDWFGLPKEEIIGKTAEEVLGPAAFRIVQRYYEEAMKGNRVSFEALIPFARGGTRAVVAEYIPDIDGTSQTVAGLVILATDMTKRKRAEEAVRESEQSLRTLANSIPQMAWMADDSGRALWYNQRWYEFTGTTFEEMQGWGWTTIHHPDHRNRVIERFVHHLQTGESWEDVFPLRSATGEWKWFLSRAKPVRDQRGKILRWFGTNTDVTEQREASEKLKKTQGELHMAVAEAQKANQAKTMFLANISHEIRTPMNAILGFSDLLLDTNLTDEKSLSYLRRIQSNGQQLLRLINDVLDLARLEEGDTPIERTKFSVIELLQDLFESLRIQARSKEMGMEILFQTEIPALICSDPHRLRQILNNVIGNALKFSDGGHIIVRLGSDPPGFLNFDVEDTGIGISIEDQGKLFQPFSQADGSIVRRFGGTGLGLVLSRRL